jgi:hypothetical protein
MTAYEKNQAMLNKPKQQLYPLEKVLRKEGWEYMYCDNTSEVWDVKALLESECPALQELCRPEMGEGEVVFHFHQYCLRKGSLGVAASVNTFRTIKTTI